MGNLMTRLETLTKVSNMCASHWDAQIYWRNESECRPSRRSREVGPCNYAAPHSPVVSFSLREEAHFDRTSWYPKDGEVCLVRTKSGETLMEVPSNYDVQIDRRTWV